MSGSDVRLEKRKNETQNFDIPDGKKKRVEPISLEDLVEKKKLEELQKAKPVFLTKEQREKAAVEKREKEVLAMKQKQELQRQARVAFLQEVEQEKLKDLKEKSNDRYNNRRQHQSKRNKPGDDKRRGSNHSNNTNNHDDKTKQSKIPIDTSLIGTYLNNFFLNFFLKFFCQFL